MREEESQVAISLGCLSHAALDQPYRLPKDHIRESLLLRKLPLWSLTLFFLPFILVLRLQIFPLNGYLTPKACHLAAGLGVIQRFATEYRWCHDRLERRFIHSSSHNAKRPRVCPGHARPGVNNGRDLTLTNDVRLRTLANSSSD